MYNIISPKQLIPYRSFDQLVNDGFTIYTKLTPEISPFMWRVSSSRQASPHRIDGQVRSFASIIGFGPSNISIPSEVLRIKKKYLRNHNETEFEFILENSKLHPDIAQVFASNQPKAYSKGFQILVETQWRLLHNAMRVCNKTAVILQEALALDMAKELVKDKGIHRVFIGEVPLYEERLALYIRGWIPGRLLEKVGAVEASGIWKWWSKTIGSSNGRFTATEYRSTAQLFVEKPTMKGNAFIIFSLISILCAVSFCAFLAEQNICLTLILIPGKKVYEGFAVVAKTFSGLGLCVKLESILGRNWISKFIKTGGFKF